MAPAAFVGSNRYADVDDAGYIWVLVGTTAVRFDPNSQAVVNAVPLAVPGTPIGFAVSGAPGATLISATATAYGLGCGTPPLALVPDVASPPRLGELAGARVANAPTQIVGAAMGFSNTFTFPVVLPFELSAIGMPGCYMNQSNEVFGLATTSSTPGSARFEYAIPPLFALAGSQVYIQAFALAPGANPLQVVVSNGVAWRLGHL